MGLLSRSLNLCQLQVEVSPDLPPDTNVKDIVAQGLKDHPFHFIDQSADERSVGWVQLEDSEDTDFSNLNTWERGDFLAFTLRQDVRKINAAVLKKQHEKLCVEFLAGNPGLQRVPKAKREELKELARTAILAKTFPVPNTVDVVWDLTSGIIYLTNPSPKMVDLFCGMFQSSFNGLRAVLLHPYARAERIIPLSQQDALRETNQAGSKTVLDMIKGNLWLGQDFLAWLLHQSMQSDSRYAINVPGPAVAGEDFVAYINDRLTLSGAGEGGVQKIVVSGPQDRFVEVKAAMVQGKSICDGTIYFEAGEHQYKLTLKGDTFAFRSYKTPNIEIDGDGASDDGSLEASLAVFFEKMHVIQSGLQMFDSLFAQFLEVRLSPSWPSVEKEILSGLQDAA